MAASHISCEPGQMLLPQGVEGLAARGSVGALVSDTLDTLDLGALHARCAKGCPCKQRARVSRCYARPRHGCSKCCGSRAGTSASRSAWRNWGRIDLLAIDDFAITPITAAEHNDLLELLDDRAGTRATMITSHLPVTAWHEWLNDPTLADAILDRIVHAVHKIGLKSESMRKKQPKP